MYYCTPSTSLAPTSTKIIAILFGIFFSLNSDGLTMSILNMTLRVSFLCADYGMVRFKRFLSFLAEITQRNDQKLDDGLCPLICYYFQFESSCCTTKQATQQTN